MRRLLTIASLGTAAIWMSACGAPATNTNTVTNTNTNSKPTAAAPTADSLLALDKQATEAYVKGDGAYFETMLSDKAVMSMGKDRMGKATIVSHIKTVKCEGVETKLSEPQMSKINDDTYALVYKNDSTGKCMENGKSVPSKPMRAATVWVRNGEKWQAAWHGENEIMGAPASGASNSNSNMTNTAMPKKEETKPAANTTANSTSTANSNSSANTTATEPAKLTPSPNTDALVKAMAAGWEAFRSKDAKFFETDLAANFIGVAPDGSVLASRDAAVKEWTGAGTMKCEGITKTSFTEGFAQAISPTVEILFGKGNADGKCGGHANGDLWNTAVYVKEGDAWKMAFMMETMPMAGM